MLNNRQVETTSADCREYGIVGGVPFAKSSMDEALNALFACASGDLPPTEFRLANAYCVVLANQNRPYGELLRTRGLNFADGQPVATILRGPHPGKSLRVRGPSFFVRALQDSDDSIRHFFLGGTPETLDGLIAAISARFPNVQIAGYYSPPFADLSPSYLDDLLAHIPRECDVVWVGMGTPKQDFVSAAVVDRLRLTAAGVGAAFDFVAGSVAEAPRWLQTLGLEWAYRLIQEPRRLWRRYVFGNVLFVAFVTRDTICRRLRATRTKRIPG